MLSKMFAKASKPKHQKTEAQKRPRLNVERLEDRTTPSTTPGGVLDLGNTSTSHTFSAFGAIWSTNQTQPAGSGVIDSFLRVDSPGSTFTEEGFNTSARKLQFNENPSRVFTRDLLTSSVPVVTIGNTQYLQFLLDLNEPNNAGAPPISLDRLEIFAAPGGGELTSPKGNLGSLGKLVYDMDAGTASGGKLSTGADGDSGSLNGLTVGLNSGVSPNGNWVLLYDTNHGSGQADMTVLVPAAGFTTSNLILYCRFGDIKGAQATGGYEEWAVPTVPIVVNGNTVPHWKNSPNGDVALPLSPVQTIKVGADVYDTATLSTSPTGSSLPSGGTVVYSFFNNQTGDGSGFLGDYAVNVNKNGTVPNSVDILSSLWNNGSGLLPPGPFPNGLPPGNYSFVAEYLGGKFNGPFFGNSGASQPEPFIVSQGHTKITTTIKDASGTPQTAVQAGTSVHDTAIVTITSPASVPSVIPTGTVTYYFFSNSNCNGQGEDDTKAVTPPPPYDGADFNPN